MIKGKMQNMSQIQTVIKITGFTGSISSKQVNKEFILPMFFSFINHLYCRLQIKMEYKENNSMNFVFPYLYPIGTPFTQAKNAESTASKCSKILRPIRIHNQLRIVNIRYNSVMHLEERKIKII